MFFFFFFFSSRRRHTRCGRDWSSDVCSSDLQAVLTLLLVTENGPLAAKSDTAGKPVPGGVPGSGLPGLTARALADSSMPMAMPVSLIAGAFICGISLLVCLVGIAPGSRPTATASG